MSENAWGECPWSTSQLRKLGRAIRDGNDLPPGLEYAEVMSWYNDLAAAVQGTIQDLNWPPLLRERPFEVTSRPKTIDTLRQKLQREHSVPLQSVQDIAGVRFEAEMSLDEQDAVVSAICGVFGQDPVSAIKDIRLAPHSGYRAVHVWLRLPARVEVQVRTHLQGAWANTYEAAADLLGRNIRYDELPANDTARAAVISLRELSIKNIAQLEANRNEIARIELGLDDDRRRTGRGALAEDDEHRLELLRAKVTSEEAAWMSAMSEIQTGFSHLRRARRSEDGE